MQRVDSEPKYPIRVVALRTGLSSHLLRAWERRYGAVEPSRAGGGGRLYSDADILRFRMLRRLTEGGHSIGQIAGLSTQELLDLLPPGWGTARPEVGVVRSGLASDAYMTAALEALEGMDAERLHGILTRAAVALTSREFADELIVPLLHRTGDLWSDGTICPAHEHVLSVQVARVLGWLATSIPMPVDARSAVAGTPARQRHELGALLASIVAAEEGWSVTYLGPDLPARDLATAARLRRAEAILLSIAFEHEIDAAVDEIRVLRSEVGAEPRILVGGLGAFRHRAAIESAGATFVADLGTLRTTLTESNPVRRKR